ncbi:MAG: PspA/IM30 family protein [Caldilineales bacterium]|nr:PspA/IM30 family protein [Caldilineales bacterium]
MASLLEKVGTLISANLHWIVNQALQANSLAVVDEYIRRVEDNLEALEDAAATVGGEAKTLRRKQREFEAKAEELDRNIDLFLREGKDKLAMAAQSRYNTMARLADTYREQADAQESEFQKLLDAKLRLEARLTEVKQERIHLQAMLELAKSKEATHEAVKAVGDVSTDAAGMDDIKGAIQRRLDKAAAQGEIDSQKLDRQMEEVLETSEIEQQLAARRARLGMADEAS